MTAGKKRLEMERPMPDEPSRLVDQVARDMAEASFMAWGSLLGTIVDTMIEAEISDEVIHDFLNRLTTANDAVLKDPYRVAFLKMIRAVRESAVPPN